MKSVYLEVDQYDTVTACMLECMKIQQWMKRQNIKIDIITKKDQYDHIKRYEIVFKNDEDYVVYQLVK